MRFFIIAAQPVLAHSSLTTTRRIIMDRQHGFTLIELMIVIAIVAILSAIGIPAWQNYLRKAALTDMLQTFLPYRTAVELCALEHGGTSGCSAGTNGIPAPKTSRYVSALTVSAGVISLTGQESLSGLGVTLTPQWSDAEGIRGWKRVCEVQDNGALKQACDDIFRFDAE
jgi:prepilin peptidase dependent protein D